MTKRFQRTIENFKCLNCDIEVSGNGYTNHCPKCLWSMHVDINPGDRAESCHGAMEPIGLEISGDKYTIVHRCTNCGAIKRVKSVKDDDFESLLSLAKK